eukprot:s1555_g6.t1
MKKTPADDVLQPLFHRQVKKAKMLSHDIAIYERAIDGSAEKTYEFLYNAVNRLIKIKRLERNRERIAKQAAAGRRRYAKCPRTAEAGYGSRSYASM